MIARKRIDAAGEAQAALSAYRRAALRSMNIVGDEALADVVAQDLAVEVSAQPGWASDVLLRVEARIDRLGRVTPLLEPTLALAVADRIEFTRQASAAQALPALRAAVMAAQSEVADLPSANSPLEELEAILMDGRT